MLRNLFAFALAALFSTVAIAIPPTVNLTLTPAIGASYPYTSTLSWTSVGAASCDASGGWSGTKAASGSVQVQVTAETLFKIDCGASDGQANLTFKPPTTSTNGVPLTTGAGYNVYRGTTVGNMSMLTRLASSATSYTDAGLAPGPYYYAVSALKSDGPESVRANAADNFPFIVTGSRTSAEQTATVEKVASNPPTNVSVTVIVKMAP